MRLLIGVIATIIYLGIVTFSAWLLTIAVPLLIGHPDDFGAWVLIIAVCILVSFLCRGGTALPPK